MDKLGEDPRVLVATWGEDALSLGLNSLMATSNSDARGYTIALLTDTGAISTKYLKNNEEVEVFLDFRANETTLEKTLLPPQEQYSGRFIAMMGVQTRKRKVKTENSLPEFDPYAARSPIFWEEKELAKLVSQLSSWAVLTMGYMKGTPQADSITRRVLDSGRPLFNRPSGFGAESELVAKILDLVWREDRTRDPCGSLAAALEHFDGVPMKTAILLPNGILYGSTSQTHNGFYIGQIRRTTMIATRRDAFRANGENYVALEEQPGGHPYFYDATTHNITSL